MTMQEHPRAKLTDHEIDMLAELVENEMATSKTPFEAYRAAARALERRFQRMAARGLDLVEASTRRAAAAALLAFGCRRTRI